MKTEKYTVSSTTTTVTYTPQSGTTKQDSGYTYDSLGNIMKISEQSPHCGIGGVTGLERDFDYDALYRLLYATGRENLPDPLPDPPYYNINPFSYNTRNPTADSTTEYDQYYQYDEMGNMQVFKHKSVTVPAANFTRSFTYGTANPSNILTNVNVWSTDYGFGYDSCGNQTLQNMDSNMLWDYADRMYCFYIQTGTAEPSQYVQYCYDASGQRVMKVSRVQGGNGYYKTRVYIGSIFEEYYEVDQFNVNQGYQDEIMVMDNQSRIASKWIGTAYGDTSPSIKYIFPDHLGSSNVQCRDDGSVFKREEYYPFGETSFGSYAKKRYRYCGKERDEESGLYYYGARYYLPWTCRFVSVDPLAAKFPNLTPFQYASNRPIIFIDIDGYEGGPPTPQTSSVPSYLNAQFKALGASINNAQPPQNSNSGQALARQSMSTTMPQSTTGIAPLKTNNLSPSQSQSTHVPSQNQTYISNNPNPPAGNDYHESASKQVSTSIGSGVSDFFTKPFNAFRDIFTTPTGGRDFLNSTSFMYKAYQGLSGPRTPESDAVINAGLNYIHNVPKMSPGEVAHDITIGALTIGSLGVGGIGDVGEGITAAKEISTMQDLVNVTGKMGGRLGNAATRSQTFEIGTELINRGYTIQGGAGRLPEEFLKPLGGGTKGGSYIDITASHPDYGTIRINTVDINKAGLPTTRELNNAARIRQQIQPGEHLLLIPKR